MSRAVADADGNAGRVLRAGSWQTAARRTWAARHDRLAPRARAPLLTRFSAERERERER